MGQKECSKKARAGTNRGGEYSTTTKNCQNRLSGAEWGFINYCDIDAHPAETDMYKENAYTGAGFASLDHTRREIFQITADIYKKKKKAGQMFVFTSDFLMNQKSFLLVCLKLSPEFSLLPWHLCLRLQSILHNRHLPLFSLHPFLIHSLQLTQVSLKYARSKFSAAPLGFTAVVNHVILEICMFYVKSVYLLRWKDIFCGSYSIRIFLLLLLMDRWWPLKFNLLFTSCFYCGDKTVVLLLKSDNQASLAKKKKFLLPWQQQLKKRFNMSQFGSFCLHCWWSSEHWESH